MQTPKYLQLKELIYKEIQDISSNNAIDSERVLSKRLGASRMTVRKALDELVEEGFLYREKNKGTFVSDKSLWKKNTTFISKESGELEYKLLNFDVKFAMIDEVLINLEITDNEASQIIRAVRVVLRNNKPLKIEEFYLRRNFIEEKYINRFDKLLDLDRYLKNNTMTQKFVPIIVPLMYAATLNLRIDEPIIMVEGLVRTKSGIPFIYYKSYNNPKERSIEITV